MGVLLAARQFVNSALRPLGFSIERLPPPPPPKMAEVWKTDERFVPLRKQITGRTLMPDADLYALYQFVRQTMSLPGGGAGGGDVAEIGVYKGGSARLLAATTAGTGKTLHLFDTFAGMPETDSQRDLHKKGDFSDTSLEGVQAFLAGFNHVSFHQGFFPASAQGLESAKFCLVHIDVDIYRSVLDCCEFFYPRMVPGGIMLFDDYGKPTCPGARQAVDEFLANKPEQACYLVSSQCFIIKHA